jgi:hypothetical protein
MCQMGEPGICAMGQVITPQQMCQKGGPGRCASGASPVWLVMMENCICFAIDEYLFTAVYEEGGAFVTLRPLCSLTAAGARSQATQARSEVFSL